MLMILVGVLGWLWFNNNKKLDPLPILSSDDERLAQDTAEADNDEVKEDRDANTLYIQAQQPLQLPLDEVIVSFEARYPHIQVLTHYVPAASLLTLDNANATDMVIADDQLSDSLLSLLEDEMNSNVKNNVVNPPATNPDSSSVNSEATAVVDSEARALSPFNYAMKNSQALEGVIVSDKPIAISFRNYLVSTAAQNILRDYNFDNIDGYQNSVDDLFNPTSNGKTAIDKTRVVSDALTNSQK